MRNGAGGQRDSETIIFRILEPEVMALLLSSAHPDEKPNMAARRILTEALKKEVELGILHSDIETFRQDFLAFHSRFQLAVEAILVAGGKCTKEYASNWVAEKLQVEPKSSS